MSFFLVIFVSFFFLRSLLLLVLLRLGRPLRELFFVFLLSVEVSFLFFHLSRFSSLIVGCFFLISCFFFFGCGLVAPRFGSHAGGAFRCHAVWRSVHRVFLAIYSFFFNFSSGPFFSGVVHVVAGFLFSFGRHQVSKSCLRFYWVFTEFSRVEERYMKISVLLDRLGLILSWFFFLEKGGG